MIEPKYRALLEKANRQAETNPRIYRLYAFAYALAGYLFPILLIGVAFGGICLSLLWMTQGTFFDPRIYLFPIALIILCIGVMVTAFTAVFPPAPPMEGIRLTETEAPALFAEIESVRRALNAPRPHAVVLSGELNAGAFLYPGFGFLRRRISNLIVGLPLMEALSREEFRAILAHEFAHFSINHNRVDNWIRRTRMGWNALNQPGAKLLRVLTGAFLRFYGPRFTAFGIALGRDSELKADACAAREAGMPAASGALLRLDMTGRALGEEFWPSVFRRSATEELPPGDVFFALADFLKRPAVPEKWTARLRQALTVPSRPDDEHPCTRVRLEVIGVKPDSQTDPPAPAKSAAEELLPEEKLRECRSYFSRDWKARVIHDWRVAHESAEKDQNLLKHLRERRETGGEMTEKDSWELVELTARYQSDEQARPLVEEFLAAHPDHVRALFHAGRLRLEANVESGIALLEQVMRRDLALAFPACERIHDWLVGENRTGEALEWQRKVEDMRGELELAEKERKKLEPKDDLAPHDLTPGEVAVLVEQLRPLYHLQALYAVRKRVKHFPQAPCHYVVIVVHKGALQAPDAVRQLSAHLAGMTAIPQGCRCAVEAPDSKITRKVSEIPGARIFTAEQ